MTLSAHITIDGYPIRVMRHYYDNTWLFRPQDRIIRTRTKGERNLCIQGLPDDPQEWDEPETDYLYVVNADVLRQRLNSAGYDRTSLELEFLRHTSTVFKSSSSPYFFRTWYPANEDLASARAAAFRAANLDDWLQALIEVKRSGLIYWNRHGTDIPANPLVDIITGHDMPLFEDKPPGHLLHGFPCISLECMAVAMLEISPTDAECVLEVSTFVIYGDDHSFDDLRTDKT